MGGPEYAWIVYGWVVSREKVIQYLFETKDNNNWDQRNNWVFEEDVDNFNLWIKAESNRDESYVEVKQDKFTLYIIDDFNDHNSASNSRVFVSLIPKKAELSIDDLINLPNNLITYGRSIADKLEGECTAFSRYQPINKGPTNPVIFSVNEVYC